MGLFFKIFFTSGGGDTLAPRLHSRQAPIEVADVTDVALSPRSAEDLTIPAFLDRRQTQSCQVCGVRDERLLLPHGEGVLLHRECLAQWLQERRQ